MNLKDRLRELDKQISQLEIERRELQKEADEEFKVDNRCHIGRCFMIGKTRWAIVVDTPAKEYTPHGVVFNRYQFPALFVSFNEEDKDCPIYYDTIFSGAWGVGDNISGIHYEEVFSDEFLHKFDLMVSRMRVAVQNAIEEKRAF